MAIGKRLNLRLFLEGIELPVVSATVQFGVRQPAMARVEVVPSAYVRNLLPRTVVHLFYYDDREPDPAPGSMDRRWKLLFAGELADVDYVKDVAARSATLTCQDCTSYWSAALKYFFNDIIFNGQQLLKMNFNNATGASGDIVFGSAAALIALLRKPCRSYPQMKGLLGGVVRILEAIGGYHVGEHTHGITDFFTVSQLRMHFYEQLGICARDDSYENLIKSASFYKWMNQIVSQGGNAFSAKDVIEAVLSVVFYNWISNPVALYESQENTKSTTTHGFVKGASQAVCEEVGKTMGRLLTALDPGGHKNAAGTGSFYSFVPKMKLDGSASTGPQAALLGQINKDIKQYDAELADAEKKMVGARSVPASGGGVLIGGKAVNHKTLYTSVEKHRMAALGNCHKFMLLYGKGHATSKTTFDTTPVQRLLTVLFAPDAFMCPPPRCNIIFPEQYERIQVSQHMLQEPTRYMVITPTNFYGDTLPQELFGPLYHFAPLVKTIDGKDIKDVVRTRRFVLPHELYSGPIPQMEWFSDIRDYDPMLSMEGGSIVKKMHAAQDKAEKEERGLADPLPYLQHVAEFNFARMRYANRTMQLPMTFTPNLVAGLPALVIDRTPVWPRENGPAEEEDADEHWLGVPQTITHRISQSGGSTTAVMNYVRGHREDASMFSVAAVDKTKVKTKSKAYRYRGTGQDLLKPRNGGQVVAIRNLETRKSYGRDVVKALYDIGVPVSVVDQIRSPTPGVPATPVYKVEMTGLDDVSVKLNAMGTPTFGEKDPIDDQGVREGSLRLLQSSSFEITEKVTEATKLPHNPVDIPFESQVRPPWFSSLFTNAKIGGFYQDLLGVSSIMDSRIGFNEQLSELRRQLGEVAAKFGFSTEASRGESTPVTEGVNSWVIPSKGADGNGTVVISDVTVDVSAGDSVAQAVEDLARLYAIVKSSSSSDRVDDLIHVLTDRPIALMEEVLGTKDLEFNPVDGSVSSGTPGFHSMAFGEVGGLFGLQDATLPMKPEHGAKSTASAKAFTIDPRVDPRPGRRSVVLAYRDALAKDKKKL